MGCFGSKALQEPVGGLPAGGQQQIAALQKQVAEKDRQLQALRATVKGGAPHGSGGADQVLWFPDPALPCKFASNCRRKNCTFAHQPTSLSRLLDVLGSARASLDVCVFTITCNQISDAVLAAHQRGVRVRIITDNDQRDSQGSDVRALSSAGIAVRCDKDAFHMHHKFAVVDAAVLLNGSFNWSRQAVLGNQENLVLSTNPLLVDQFRQHFEVLWNKYQH